MGTTDIGARIHILRDEQRPMIERSLLGQADDPSLDSIGDYSVSLAYKYRLAAVADYYLDHDIASLRANMVKSAELYLGMQRRYDKGEPIDWSYMSMIGARPVFDALAGNDRDLAERIAQRMGGRHSIEERNDRDFDVALGYAVKWLILEEDAKARPYIDDLAVACRDDPETRNFAGYPFVLQAIVDGDAHGLQTAFTELLEGHRRDIATQRGLFRGNEDELLACWGLGLANLAHWRGLAVVIDDPLIPADLIG